MGIPELREAVAEYYNSRFGLDISDGQVIVTSGTSPVMLLLFFVYFHFTFSTFRFS